MPAKFAAQDFRNYIKTNFVLEGNKSLSDRHMKELGKTLEGHATMGKGFHAPTRNALIYGKHAAPVSEQHAFSLTKHLLKAAKLGEIEVAGKKLEIEREFKDVRGQGQLAKSVHEIGVDVEAAKKEEEAKVEPDKKPNEVRRGQNIIQKILGIGGTPVTPGLSARMNVRGSLDPAGGAVRPLQRLTSASEVKPGQITKAPGHIDPTVPMVSTSIGQVQRGATPQTSDQTIAAQRDQTLPPSSDEPPTDSAAPAAEPAPATEDDADDSTPPPAADDEMMI